MKEKLEKIKNSIIDRYFEVVDDTEEVVNQNEASIVSQREVPQQEVKHVVQKVQKLEPTSISEGTFIQGHIQSKADVKLNGKIVGNITVDGNVTIENGEVSGDIIADSVLIISSHIKGNIKSRTKINIQNNSFVEGHMKSKIVVIDSECKGNIIAETTLKLLSTAKLTGDVQTRKVKIEEGAYLEGQLKMIEDQQKQDS